MATGNAAMLLKDISGQIGKQIVVKQYADKTVIAKFPDMPKHKATALKAVYEDRFRKAYQYAQAIKDDPVLKAKYQATLPPGKRVYNAALSEYLKREKAKSSPFPANSDPAKPSKSAAKVKSIKDAGKGKSKKGKKSATAGKAKSVSKTTKKAKKPK